MPNILSIERPTTGKLADMHLSARIEWSSSCPNATENELQLGFLDDTSAKPDSSA